MQAPPPSNPMQGMPAAFGGGQDWRNQPQQGQQQQQQPGFQGMNPAAQQGQPGMGPQQGQGGPGGAPGQGGYPGAAGGPGGYPGAPGGMPGQRNQLTEWEQKANCSKRVMQMTVGAFPNSQSLAQRLGVPIGCLIQPLAQPPPDRPVPVVNFGSIGVVRCKRCRAYINPFVQWTDNGTPKNLSPSSFFCFCPHTAVVVVR